MTDFEKVKALFDELGIEHSDRLSWESDERRAKIAESGDRFIILQEGNRKISGYCGFWCQFVFDAHGKLIEVGIWE